jgi:hypothetical protein
LFGDAAIRVCMTNKLFCIFLTSSERSK